MIKRIVVFQFLLALWIDLGDDFLLFCLKAAALDVQVANVERNAI